jgi:hypothetical protein
MIAGAAQISSFRRKIPVLNILVNRIFEFLQTRKKNIGPVWFCSMFLYICTFQPGKRLNEVRTKEWTLILSSVHRQKSSVFYVSMAADLGVYRT